MMTLKNFILEKGVSFQYIDQTIIKSKLFKCDRGRIYRNRSKITDVTKKRKSTTRLTGCKFNIISLFMNNSWVVDKIFEKHNH